MNKIEKKKASRVMPVLQTISVFLISYFLAAGGIIYVLRSMPYARSVILEFIVIETFFALSTFITLFFAIFVFMQDEEGKGRKKRYLMISGIAIVFLLIVVLFILIYYSGWC